MQKVNLLPLLIKSLIIMNDKLIEENYLQNITDPGKGCVAATAYKNRQKSIMIFDTFWWLSAEYDKLLVFLYC